MADLKETILNKMQGPNIWSLATVTEDGKPWVRYVAPTRVDPDLTVWVATFVGSRKVAQIRKNQEVHLTMGMTELVMEGSYLQVQARARVVDDPEQKKRSWHDHLRAYFSGPDDPNFVLLELKPYRVEYMTMTSMEPQVWKA